MESAIVGVLWQFPAMSRSVCYVDIWRASESCSFPMPAGRLSARVSAGRWAGAHLSLQGFRAGPCVLPLAHPLVASGVLVSTEPEGWRLRVAGRSVEAAGGCSHMYPGGILVRRWRERCWN